MRIFDLDSPLINFLNKVADLMWLNILTIICCIPVVTAGAAFTALHYVSLKIVRNEEGYITKGYFKSFKENFKQATVIWLILLLITAALVGDFYIILKAGLEFGKWIRLAIMMVSVFVVFTACFVFPVLAKFENSIRNTIKNAFFMSVLQFPKTIVMIVLYAAPVAIFLLNWNLFPFVMLFGFSLPTFCAAVLYNKFFQNMEDKMMAAAEPAESDEEDERVFRDELDEGIVIDEGR